MSDQATAAPAADRAARRRSLTAVIVAMAMVNLNYALSFPLLALLIERQGISSTLNGFSTAAQAVAGLLVAPFAGRLIQHFGAGRVMQVALGAEILIYLAFPAMPDYAIWLPLRLAMGICGTLLWIASEAWINMLAEEAKRGRVIGIYSTAASIGGALGPIILLAVGSQGWPPFLAVAAITAVALIPLSLRGQVRPNFAATDKKRSSIWRFLWIAPLPILLNFTFAASAESLHSFFAIFALAEGHSETFAFSLLTAFSIGGMALQYPLGWAADHMERRLLLAICIAASAVMILAIPLALPTGLAAYGYFFLFGGFMTMLYSFGVILLGERFGGADLAQASSAFTMMWGAGALVGPPIAGAAMDLLGPQGLIWATAAMLALYLPLPIRAWIGRRAS